MAHAKALRWENAQGVWLAGRGGWSWARGGAVIQCCCVCEHPFQVRIKYIHPRGSAGSLELESQESGTGVSQGLLQQFPE